MPEPFKNAFNPKMIAMMGAHLKRMDKSFDDIKFIKLATDELDSLELKQRSTQICKALEHCLPDNFETAAQLLLSSLHPDADVELSGQDMGADGIRGWAIMPINEYIFKNGLSHFDLSMEILRETTGRFTSEFAVRTFLLFDKDRAMVHFKKWAQDTNSNIRRLASEGSRPRLPWGQKLSMFVEDPTEVISLLESLKDDSSEYVRRSVANNLNDIAKDHPDLVAEIAARWLNNADENRTRLVRHACRTLIKQGHPDALAAFGFTPPKLDVTTLEIPTTDVQFGTFMEFTTVLHSTASKPQNLMVDYVVHHRKANGTTSPKVFKWKTVKLEAGQTVTFSKKHPMKPITTRKYYEGVHSLTLQVNGRVLGNAAFNLIMND